MLRPYIAHFVNRSCTSTAIVVSLPIALHSSSPKASAMASSKDIAWPSAHAAASASSPRTARAAFTAWSWKIAVEYASDLAAQKLAEARHEPLGLLDMGRMPAVGYEFEGSFWKTGSRLLPVRVGEYSIARSPHDERRHLQV
jgi:hypothetical protein